MGGGGGGGGGALMKLPESAIEMATLQYWVESARQPDDPESWQCVWTRRTQNSKYSYKKEKLGSVEHKLSDLNFFLVVVILLRLLGGCLPKMYTKWKGIARTVLRIVVWVVFYP